MSGKQKIKHMSSDELKRKMYSHFKKSGTLDHLQAQLRGQMYSTLFKISEPVDTNKFPKVSDVEKCVLPLQVCNWLVFDHLSRQNYQYTLSTFVSEAQLPSPEKFLTAGDVLCLLGLKNTADYENISKLYSINNELGFLHSLLLSIIKTTFHVSNQELTLGTDNDKTEVISSENEPQDGHKESTSFTQSKLEAAANRYFKGLPQFNQTSLNKSVLSCVDERSAEESFHKELQSFKEEKENEVQRMRHRLLDELETLHSEKSQMQSDLEHAKSELKKEQDKLLKEKETLKEKEVLLKKELTNQSEMKVKNLEREFSEKLHLKEKEIESLKRKLNEKDEKLAYSEVELNSEKENKNRMEQKLYDLEREKKTLLDKYSSLLDENTNLRREYGKMSDYSRIKEELAIKSREVTRLQNEIKELFQKSEDERRKFVETVRNLESNVNMKESELMQTREEIDDLRSTLKREHATWNKERRKYDNELKEMKVYYDTVMQTLEEKNEEIDDLRQTNQKLNYKLANSVINAAKSESVGMYRMHQRAESIPKRNAGMLFTKRNTFQPQPEKEYDSKFKFLSDKKSIYGALKQDENKVQEQYSVVLNTVPEYNKSTSYPNSSNFLPFPKKNIDSYSAFLKPVTACPSFNCDKSKLPTFSRTPFSLSDGRRMVSNSLSPYKSYMDFKVNTGNFSSTSQVPNASSTVVKNIWTVPESSSQHDFHRHFSLAKASDNTSTLSSMRHTSAIAQDNVVSENALHSSSTDKNTGENFKISSNLREFNNEVATGNDSSDKRDDDNAREESLRKNSLETNNNEGSHDFNENSASTIPQNSKAISGQQYISNKNCAITTQAQSVSVDSSHPLHTMTSKTTGNEPKSNPSVFINLDDAWKKRSSITSLPYREGRIGATQSQERTDGSLYPSSVISHNANESKTFNVNLGKLDKMNLENVPDKSAEKLDNSMKDNAGNSSYLQQTASKQVDDSLIQRESSLCDKSVINLDSDKTDSENVYHKSANVGNNSVQSNTISTSHLQPSTSKQTGDSLHVDRELPLYEKSIADTDIIKTKLDIAGYPADLQTLGKETSGFVTNQEVPLKEIKEKSSSSSEKVSNEEEKARQSEAEGNENSSIKTGNSLSELSELHFSCGSEAEQQKEDSDAW